MKVLVTAEHSLDNLYIYYHYLGICKDAEVVNAIDPFWTSNLRFDIVHINWPEFLVDYRIHRSNIYEQLEDRLKYWTSLGTKIVVTRHNYQPHNPDLYPLSSFQRVYDLVYEYSHAIVHHGENSLSEFINHKEYCSKKNVVISHPSYLVNLKNSITRNEARKRLNIEEHKVLFVSLGDIRLQQEENILLEAFSKGNVPNQLLLVTRSIFTRHIPGKRTPFAWIKHKRQEQKYNKLNIVFDKNKFVPNDDIQTYMNAADAIIAPRINNLNSGILYLALSFGKVVVGPNVGNIGEVLDKIGNPKFEPNDTKSLTKAMEVAYTQSLTNAGEKNLEYVKNECDIYTLGQQYIDLYKEITSR